jgi:fumarate hydratase subunit alpha
MNLRPVIQTEEIGRKVFDACLSMNVELPPDVERALLEAGKGETGPGREVLHAIQTNLAMARTRRLPMCQDCGMVVVFVELGHELVLEGPPLPKVIDQAVADAYRDGYFRKSVVADPLFHRTNTHTNLPVVLHTQMIEGSELTVRIMTKGFGSENYSRLVMMRPTQSVHDVEEAVLQAVRDAGGNPCPPIIVGLGLGGTSDMAMVLAKKALFRRLDEHHPDPEYRELEERLRGRINELGLGPGGLGGGTTALGVKIETFGTHIAGLPLGICICCWADRRQSFTLQGTLPQDTGG